MLRVSVMRRVTVSKKNHPEKTLPVLPASIAKDVKTRPELFQWNGRVDAASLASWTARTEWPGTYPRDLLSFWEETGGGDVFETETILGPLSSPGMGDDLVAVNRSMWLGGMPERFLAFHLGMIVSAVDASTGDYVELQPSTFQVVRRFVSMDDWYVATLRKEYGERYRL